MTTRDELELELEAVLAETAMKPEAETAMKPEAETAMKPDALLAGLRTGEWLDQQEFPPLRYVVPALIPEGLTLLVGGPKIGKSWLSLAIVLAVASGGQALGHIAVGPARPVLLLALEDGHRRLQERIRTLQPGESIPPRLAYMTTIKPGMVVPTIEAWLETLDADAVPLVILDTLGKVMPEARAGESAYQRDYRVAGRLKLISDARPGMALVVLHHDRKANSDDFVDSVSGTNGIAGAADTIVVMTRPRTETQGLLKVTGRDVEEAEYAVTMEQGSWTLQGDTLAAAAGSAATVRATAKLSDRSVDVLRYAAKHPTGVTAGDIAQALGLTKNAASVYLGRLFDAGKLRKPTRGLYTPVVLVGLSGSNSQDNTSNTSDNTSTTNTHNRGVEACKVCGFPLDQQLLATGDTTHPTCQPW